MDDAEIALKKWGATKLAEVGTRHAPAWRRHTPPPEVGWRDVTVTFDEGGTGCPTCGPDWPAFDISAEGHSTLHVGLYDFPEVLAELFAVEITDEDRQEERHDA